MLHGQRSSVPVSARYSCSAIKSETHYDLQKVIIDKLAMTSTAFRCQLLYKSETHDYVYDLSIEHIVLSMQMPHTTELTP